MSSLYYLVVLFGYILLTNAVNLDISCGNASECGGTGAICPDKICRCETPWYIPCNTSDCVAKNTFVYEGDECRVDANCLENALCNTKDENKCRCKQDFIAYKGLCYKKLNASCGVPSECWSGECRDSVCKCRDGFVPMDDNIRCRRKLAIIYTNWTQANESNDFCYEMGSSGCAALFAVCRNDSQHSEMFCQCPSTHTINNEKQTCELMEYDGLSPSINRLPDTACGKCKDDNALCASVSKQTTCWCRAGYMKNNNQDTCELIRKKLIFPNSNDVQTHNYTEDCPYGANNGLCTCPPASTFVDPKSLCAPIQPKWQNNEFEYGVCTRINSNGDPISPDELCPAPLKCEEREDKHVCSCGRDKYLDETTNTCYYFLERALTNPNSASCPPDSTLINTTCQCTPNGIYTVSSDKKRCELTLSQDNSNCNPSDATNDGICAAKYGKYAKFCRQGVCQCMSNSSYANDATCVTLLYVDPGVNGTCPLNARNIGGQCICDDGHGATNYNRSCVRKVNQIDESTRDFNVTLKDCFALFPEQPVNRSSNWDSCVCENGAFYNSTICVFTLNYTIPTQNFSRIQCPKDASSDSRVCTCNTGYQYSNDRTCVRKTDIVYRFGETNGINIPGLQAGDCRALFGYASILAPSGGYCTCANESVAFWDNNKCYFLVEISQTAITPNSACPPGSQLGTYMCNCPDGYKASQGNRGCERKPIASSQLQATDLKKSLTPCDVSYTDRDCIGLHGDGAVCRNNTCYCDHTLSFVQGNRCVLYSSYIFPGAHEHNIYTCDTNDDCGDDADQNGIECNFVNNNQQNYKVCKCKDDYSLNPQTGTCVKNQCDPQCSDKEECRNYQCVCKDDYYQNAISKECEPKFDTKLNLYDRCNYTWWNMIKSPNEGQTCSSTCDRVECIIGYHDVGSKCEMYKFNDRCGHDRDICSQVKPGSQCNVNENQCTCPTGFYQEENECIPPVDAPCQTNEECGMYKRCLGRRCACTEEAKEKETTDADGRVIRTCIKTNTNGVGQIQFNSVLLLLLLFIAAYVFIA